MIYGKTSIGIARDKLRNIGVILLASTIMPISSSSFADETTSWDDVQSFAYQLQDVDPSDIGGTSFDLLIIDYSKDGSDEERYSLEEISGLKNSAGGPKLVLSYMSIGEAENYRGYWNNHWDSNEDGVPNSDAPDWLGLSNIEWEGNYKVKYWDSDWKEIVFDYLDRVIEAGYDGVYLDIIDAYEYWGPEGESGLGRESAEQDMVDFVIEIAQYAREKSGNPDFGIFPQNGEALSLHPEYVEVVSGIGREDVWYTDDDPNPEEELEEALSNLDEFRRKGKLVLVTDYVTDEELRSEFYSKASSKGYVPYAGVRDLDRLNVWYPEERADSPRGIESATLTETAIRDHEGNEAGALTGSQLLVSTSISNNNEFEDQPFLLIIEIIDPNGFVEGIEFQSGVLPPSGSAELTFSWIPASSGDYTIKSFAISSLEETEILSPSIGKTIAVIVGL